MLTNGCWKNQLFASAIATVSSFSLIIHCSLMAFVFVADYSYWLLLFCYSSLHLHHNSFFCSWILNKHHHFLFILTCSFIQILILHAREKKFLIENKWILNSTKEQNCTQNLFTKIVLMNREQNVHTHSARVRFEHIGWYHSLNDDDATLSAVD